ncbi:MAG: GDSL-type esterase/lipase family protein [Arachidicoccus sp.]|nr:GDSL-type esterase/lipase family protein [Arachidicoccus sp.]
MKKFSLLFFTTIIIIGFISFKNKPRTIVFFGDSITQMGLNEKGYITLLKNDLVKENKANDIDLIGAGVGGNEVYDLYLRMEKDVLDKNPDEVVVWVGINDVWHKTSGTGCELGKFDAFYKAIIEKLQSKGIKVYVCTPSTIGEKNDITNPQDGDLNLYAQHIRDFAKKYNCTLIDFRNQFHEYEVNNNKDNAEKGVLTLDGVHPNDKGNVFVADILKQSLKL